MRITAQDENYFGLAEIKAWLRVNHDAEDDVIARCLDSAVQYYENATGLFLRKTEFIARFTESPIELVTRPWVSIDESKDDDGETITVTRYEAPGEVTVLEWDSDSVGALNLEWTVGVHDSFGNGRQNIPAMSAQAVRAITADCYVNRNYENPVQLYPGSISAGMLFGEARTSI